MSCPCTSNGLIGEEETPKHDLLDEILAKRFSREDLLFCKIFLNLASEVESTKICIIETEKLESFMKNKNNLKYAIKKEVNQYNI